MSKTVKDLTAGTAGGIAQVLVGQPFDIVKVVSRMLSLGICNGMLHVQRHYYLLFHSSRLEHEANANSTERNVFWDDALRWWHSEE